jgi:hypothetical protein
MLRLGKAVHIMHFRILAVPTILTASLAYSHEASAERILSPRLQEYAKPSGVTTRIQTSVEEYAIWLDETKWKQKTTGATSEFRFSHVNGDIAANVVTDRIAMPTNMFWEALLKEAKQVDPNLRVISKEERIVNGRQILAVQFSVTIEGDLFRILGYYHGGSSGSIQAIAFAFDTTFANNIGEITDFLNGLEISDQEVPSSSFIPDHMPYPGLLSISSKISLTYDPNKWKQVSSNEFGPFEFSHSSGHGSAVVALYRTSFPKDLIPELALSKVRSRHPNAKLLAKEKRNVNGSEVLFLKIETGDNTAILCAYYYSDNGGTIQALTYADQTFFSEHEKDFTDFLNGLRISNNETRRGVVSTTSSQPPGGCVCWLCRVRSLPQDTKATDLSATGRFPSTPITIGIVLRTPMPNSAHPAPFR